MSSLTKGGIITYYSLELSRFSRRILKLCGGPITSPPKTISKVVLLHLFAVNPNFNKESNVTHQSLFAMCQLTLTFFPFFVMLVLFPFHFLPFTLASSSPAPSTFPLPTKLYWSLCYCVKAREILWYQMQHFHHSTSQCLIQPSPVHLNLHSYGQFVGSPENPPTSWKVSTRIWDQRSRRVAIFLRIEVARSNKGIFISQRKYIISWKKLVLTGCKPEKPPTRSNHK